MNLNKVYTVPQGLSPQFMLYDILGDYWKEKQEVHPVKLTIVGAGRGNYEVYANVASNGSVVQYMKEGYSELQDEPSFKIIAIEEIPDDAWIWGETVGQVTIDA